MKFSLCYNFVNKKWSKIENSKLNKTIVKVLLNNVPMFLANIFASIAITEKTNLCLYISLTVFFILLFLLIVDFYSAIDECKKNIYNKKIEDIKNVKTELSNYKEIIEAYDETFLSIQSILEITAQNINKLRYELISNNKSSEATWDFKQTCFLICKDIFTSFSKTYRDNDFEVTYISFKKDDEDKMIAEMIAYANRDAIPPSIYKKEIQLARKMTHKKRKQKYNFERVYHKGKSDCEVLLSEDEIKNEFIFSSQTKKDECKYKQFIAIPILCNSNKVIGILQIASFKKNLIKGDSQTIKKHLILMLRSLSYFSLLANKTEHCIEALMEVNNKNGKQ